MCSQTAYRVKSHGTLLPKDYQTNPVRLEVNRVQSRNTTVQKEGSSMRQQFVRMIWVILFALFGATLFVGVAFGQINRANLNGTVTDPSGASIPNAQVEVVAPDTGFKRQTTTGSSGVYSISSLPTGTYDLTVSGNGFKTFEEKGIQLSVGQTRTVNVQLVVGAPTTTVEVRASAQALDSNNAEISTVIRIRTSGEHPPERARLVPPHDARPGRGQPRRRRPAGPAIRRARHRRQQLHLRWSRCHGRPGAEPEGGCAPGHFAGIDRRVPRQFLGLYRGSGRVGRGHRQHRIEDGDERAAHTGRAVSNPKLILVLRGSSSDVGGHLGVGSLSPSDDPVDP